MSSFLEFEEDKKTIKSINIDQNNKDLTLELLAIDLLKNNNKDLEILENLNAPLLIHGEKINSSNQRNK